MAIPLKAKAYEFPCQKYYIMKSNEEKFNESIQLLERWESVHVPANLWASPGYDYELPEDTSNFLRDCSHINKDEPIEMEHNDGIIELLQQIHDEADHIIGTDAENHREVAITNAEEIKLLSLKAMKLLSILSHVKI